MSYLSASLPILITGGVLVGLPVLLHLIMRQEPKRLTFPAFRFLKQQRRINQRKLRLRHWLLLFLRMMLIALICVALTQPSIISQGLNLGGGQPVNAILILDTSPSMGYILFSDRSALPESRKEAARLLGEGTNEAWTALDDARARMLEMLNEFPAGSRVAIVDTADRGRAYWANSLNEARNSIKAIKKPKGNSLPVTNSIESAYTLFARVGAELEPGQETFPKILAVFSDRTTPSWDSSRQQKLIELRDNIPEPKPIQLYVDVGTDKPVNMAITGVEMRPQMISANQPAVINITVEAVGQTYDNIIQVNLDGEKTSLPINFPAGNIAVRQFKKEGLKPGLHQAKISLLTGDNLPMDNDWYLTFRVREPRRVLTLVNPPEASLLTGGMVAHTQAEQQVTLWKTFLDAHGLYTCDVRATTPYELSQINWSQYEAVALLGVRSPSDTLWRQLKTYVEQGGHLIVAPAGPEMDIAAYQTPAALAVLPKKFLSWKMIPETQPPVSWTWDALDPGRPMLKVLREFRESSPGYFQEQAPFTRGLWTVENPTQNRDRIVVGYNDAPDPSERSPAVLEWGIGQVGRVVQFTVPITTGAEKYHTFARKDPFFLILVNETVRTLLGDSEDQKFTYFCGDTVVVRLPNLSTQGPNTFYFTGPDVSPNDAIFNRGNQSLFRFDADKGSSAGQFTLESEDGKFVEGFSLNYPPSESNLERFGSEIIEEVFGPNSVVQAVRDLDLAKSFGGNYAAPIELFPFLMIGLLLFMAFENLLSNKFYGRKKKPAS